MSLIQYIIRYDDAELFCSRLSAEALRRRLKACERVEMLAGRGGHIIFTLAIKSQLKRLSMLLYSKET